MTSHPNRSRRASISRYLGQGGMMNTHHVLTDTHWPLLAQQKLSLLRVLNNDTLATDDRLNLEGILNWIDALQDAAERDGYPVVFLSDDE